MSFSIYVILIALFLCIISGTIGLHEALSPETEIAALKQNVSMTGSLVSSYLTLLTTEFSLSDAKSVK